jgi:hypothetical protein
VTLWCVDVTSQHHNKFIELTGEEGGWKTGALGDNATSV